MCSAGDRPAGARIGSPVAGRAGQRVTNGSEAPRQPHPWGERKFSGRNESEREVAPKVSSPGGRARNCEGEGCMARCKPIDTTSRSGGVVSDGTRTRTRRATGETLLVPTRKGGSWVSRITGNTGKSADDERVTDGLVVCAGQRDGQEGSSPSGARMRGAVSESGGNSSRAGERKVGSSLGGARRRKPDTAKANLKPPLH